AVRIIRQIDKARVPLPTFLKLLALAKKISHSRAEGKPIATAFILKPEQDSHVYQTQYKVDIGEPFEIDLFTADIKEIQGQAIKVNGEDKAFIVTTGDGSEVPKWAIQSLKPVAPALTDEVLKGDARWRMVAHNTWHSGCALVVPGDAAPRVK